MGLRGAPGKRGQAQGHEAGQARKRIEDASVSRSPLASTVLQPPRERGGRGPTHPPLTHRPQLCSCAVGSGHLLRLSGARAGGHETRSGAETQRTTFWPPPGSDKRARLGRQEHVFPPMDGEDRGVNARGILYLLSALACQRVASNGKNHNPRSALSAQAARSARPQPRGLGASRRPCADCFRRACQVLSVVSDRCSFRVNNFG